MMFSILIVKTKNKNIMHDLKAMYKKTFSIAKEFFKDDINAQGNFRPSARHPKMSDLAIISLAVCAESASIDSENLLFSKLKTNYSSMFPQLIHRTRYNRRRRALREYIQELIKRIAMKIGKGSTIDLVDSMPCPVVKNSRERSYSICKEALHTAPRKGYSAVDKRFYIGYKLHLLSSEHGVIQDLQITPANVHDIHYLKKLNPEYYTRGKTIIGDKGYISAQVQTDLFTEHNINLKVPYKRNQKESHSHINYADAKKRRRIETQFSQLCDQFRIKWNYAKTYVGFTTRIFSKVAAIGVLQLINIEKKRPLNHIKHAWA